MFNGGMKYLAVFLGSVMCSMSVNAQMFSSSEADKTGTVSKSSTESGWGKFYNSSQASGQANVNSKSQFLSENSGKNEVKASSVPAKQDVTNPKDYIYKNVPQIDRPTLDGVKRGRTSVVPVVQGTEKPASSEGYIYLFYSDFSVGRMMSGSTTCDVSFMILSTFDRRLNSLAVRLKWPHMDTPVTFIDIDPNQKYKMTYTLLGEGCYSMDKIPNIVVNRCRIKGMTQEECARRIRWIREI